MKTGFCIICRENGKDLTDEHVIPDAIGGVYHIYNVCKDCNSKLGDTIDNNLINHWLTQGFRHIYKIGGKRKLIPNPLIGKGELDSGQRVRTVEDATGKIKPIFIPSSPEVTEGEDGSVNIKFSVDASEEKDIDKIIDKVLKRNSIVPDKVNTTRSERQVNVIEHPTVKQTVCLDTHKFKLALIKIAYEFATDKIPGYIDDGAAIKISKILHRADFDAVTDELFLGSGFVDKHSSKNVFSELVDFTPNRHILILANIGGALYGIVHISNIFCGAIKLSDRCYGDDNYMICMSINDVLKHTCVFYSLPELVSLFTDGGGVKL